MGLVLTRKVVKALKASIQHWEAYANGNGATEGYPDAGSCALCGLFMQDNCKGCPVVQTTGAIYCFKTPYKRVVRLIDYLRVRRHKDREIFTDPEFIRLAKQELNFLRKILAESTPRRRAKSVPITPTVSNHYVSLNRRS